MQLKDSAQSRVIRTGRRTWVSFENTHNGASTWWDLGTQEGPQKSEVKGLRICSGDGASLREIQKPLQGGNPELHHWSVF